MDREKRETADAVENVVHPDTENKKDQFLRKKVITGLILVILLPLLSGVFLYLLSGHNDSVKDQERLETRLDHVAGVVVMLIQEAEEEKKEYEIHLRKSADLTALALTNYIRDGVYEGPELFEDGLVMRKEGNRYLFPEGVSAAGIQLPAGFPDQMESDLFESQIGFAQEPEPATVAVRMLTEDYCYLEWTFKKEEQEYLNANFDLDNQMLTLESVTNGNIVVFDENGKVIYNPFQISDESIQEAMHIAASGNEQNDTMMGDCYLREIEGGHLKILFILLPEEDNTIFHNRTTVIICLLMIILAGLFSWIISAIRMTRYRILTEAQKNRYQPARMKNMAAAAGTACVILVFFASLFLYIMNGLYRKTAEASRALDSLEAVLPAFSERGRTASEDQKDWFSFYVERAAAVIEHTDGIVDNSVLGAWNYILDSEYLMTFDENGRETGCSGEYVRFSLDDDPAFSMFRKLTMGVDKLVSEPCTDPITGKNVQLFGAKIRRDTDNGYGVLLAAVNPFTFEAAKTDELISQIMFASAPSDIYFFTVDPETSAVIHSNVSFLTGRNLADSGFRGNEMNDSTMCTFDLFGMPLYGSSRSMYDVTAYYGSFASSLARESVMPALGSAFAALVCILLLIVYLFAGYDQKYFEKYASVGTEVVRGANVEIVTGDGRIKKTRDPSRRWRLTLSDWKDLLPEQKAEAVIKLSCGVVILTLLFWFYRSGQAADSLAGYILSGSWDKGINLFSVSSAILVAGTAYAGMFIFRVIIQLLCNVMDTKGETILRLVCSLAEYAVVFTVLFYAFHSFGIDTSALLATMGLVSLALSIGSRDLVSDIIAGITIVFEGEFQVGDIVEIDGYRGRVEEIGVRSTKLIGMGDNVKIINNRDIRNVLNTSRFNSWYAMQLNISSTYDLNKMEEILKQELPNIQRRMTNLISGPYYRGVESIGANSFRITILAECREEDYRWIQRQLNREIRLLFDREGIPIL